MNTLVHVIILLLSIQSNRVNLTEHFNQILYQDSLISVEMDQEFGITEGNTVKLTSEEITVQLIKVLDSRCPKDVNCIRAGEIEVDVKVILKDQVTEVTLRNPTWERGGTMEASLGEGIYLSLNGAFQEHNHIKGEAMKISFVFSQGEKQIDTPKSH